MYKYRKMKQTNKQRQQQKTNKQKPNEMAKKKEEKDKEKKGAQLQQTCKLCHFQRVSLVKLSLNMYQNIHLLYFLSRKYF